MFAVSKLMRTDREQKLLARRPRPLPAPARKAASRSMNQNAAVVPIV
jgi:hypothetical protein